MAIKGLTSCMDQGGQNHMVLEIIDADPFELIESLKVIGGELKPRALSLVVEWATLHQDELRQDWQLARSM